MLSSAGMFEIRRGRGQLAPRMHGDGIRRPGSAPVIQVLCVTSGKTSSYTCLRREGHGLPLSISTAVVTERLATSSFIGW